MYVMYILMYGTNPLSPRHVVQGDIKKTIYLDTPAYLELCMVYLTVKCKSIIHVDQYYIGSNEDFYHFHMYIKA